MREVLLELRDAWFTIEEGGQYEIMHFTWLPKKALIAEWEGTQNAAKKKVADQAVQAQSQAIANGSKKRLGALNDEDQLIRQLSVGTPPNKLPAPGSIQQEESIWAVISYRGRQKGSMDNNSRNKEERYELLQRFIGDFKRNLTGLFHSIRIATVRHHRLPATPSKEKPPQVSGPTVL